SSVARGELIISPSNLIGEFYGRTLTESDLRSPTRLLEVGSYVLVHGFVLAMLFSPAIIFSARLVSSFLRGGSTSMHGRQTLILVTFVAFSAASIFTMTAIFSESVGLHNDFERHRIHGRYWTFLMPWLALIA